MRLKFVQGSSALQRGGHSCEFQEGKAALLNCFGKLIVQCDARGRVKNDYCIMAYDFEIVLAETEVGRHYIAQDKHDLLGRENGVGAVAHPYGQLKYSMPSKLNTLIG